MAGWDPDLLRLIFSPEKLERFVITNALLCWPKLVVVVGDHIPKWPWDIGNCICQIYEERSTVFVVGFESQKTIEI